MLRRLIDFSARWRKSVSERKMRQKTFDNIHRLRLWDDGESVSGPGSEIARTSLFRADLEILLADLGVNTILDAGCGDFNWLPTFNLSEIRVTGVDIVPELVSTNRRRYPQIRFEVADIVTDALPKCDLILCRDALVHLGNEEALRALANFRRSGAKWLLTNTFIERYENVDIKTGAWRPLNLQLAPFSLPAPTRFIDERCYGYDGAYRDKRLALWTDRDLPSGIV